MESKDPKEILEYLEKEYGVSVDDLKWMSNYHKTVTKYGDWIARTIVTTVVGSILAGVFYMLWMGFKHVFVQFLHMLPK